ncbi:MAG: glycosyl hydrolase [Chloroflexaceae bacterium]|nr:glycosyl hydrolase [Chloroflexaceae bacterium]
MQRLVLFVLLCVVLLASLPAAQPTAAAPIDSAFGVNSHIASRYPVFETLESAADAVAQTGVGWAREEFQMHRIEARPGQFDWGFNDRMVDLLSARGIQIVGLLNPAVGWATPFPGDGFSDPSFYPPDPQTFAAFAARVVERYRGRISHWQVWNEPENATYWQPAPDPAAYATLLKTVYPAIKAANPDARVLIAGTVSFDLSFLRGVAASGAWGSFDILAVHPYVDPFTPEAGQIGAAGVVAAKTLSDSVGSKPVWVTEFGWATGPSDRDPAGQTNEENQARYLVRAMALLRAAGAERIFWYKLKDDSDRNMYGLYRFGGGRTDMSQPKPARNALRVLHQQLAGSSMAGLRDLGERQVVVDFEQFGTWRRGDQPNGTLNQSGEQKRSGSFSARLDYNFPGGGNDFVVFLPQPRINLPGTPSQLGMWVYGDGSGSSVKLWLRDAQGETLQYRLGFVGGAGWQFLSTAINGPVESFNRVSGSGNLQLDYPASLAAIVLDDEPDSASRSGTIYLDDITAVSGAEAYGVGFARGGELVQLLWAPQGGQVGVPSGATQGQLVDRDGGSRAVSASNGRFVLDLGPSPVYLITPNTPVPPTPSPVPPSPTPQPQPPGGGPQPSDGSYADAAFQGLWQRTDQPLAQGAPGLTPRSWLWGPQPLTNGLREAYDGLPGGSRLVQYFDKSRMEINDPAAPRNQWFVTNGLLVVELLDGRVRLGENRFEERGPAEEALAGDPAPQNPTAPTYRSLRSVAFPTNPARSPERRGQPVIATLAKDGSTAEDARLARYGVTYDSYEATLGRNIPQVFMRFFAQRGVVWENGGYRQGQILDWVFALGLPISDPYWTRARIGGVERDVLVQAFERRVLTYTPDNDPNWRVEMGNVGQHYLRWRYGR